MHVGTKRGVMAIRTSGGSRSSSHQSMSASASRSESAVAST